MLYLSDYIHMNDRYELPADLTQESIAYGCGIQRKHLSQYLADLIQDGLVAERKAHIHGMKQRMHGYYLTPLGHDRGKALKGRLGDLVVPVIVNRRTRTMKVSEIDDATSIHLTYCDIVREAIQDGALHMARLEEVEEKKRRALEKHEESTDSYKRALETAWRDGRVTATERFLIDELRKLLKISDEDHKALEAEILKKLAQDHMEFRRIYQRVLEIALADGLIDGPEAEILENLRRSMRISIKEHDELVEDVRAYLCGPGGTVDVESALEE